MVCGIDCGKTWGSVNLGEAADTSTDATSPATTATYGADLPGNVLDWAYQYPEATGSLPIGVAEEAYVLWWHTMNGTSVDGTGLYSAELIAWQGTIATSFAAGDRRNAEWDAFVAQIESQRLEWYEMIYVQASFCYVGCVGLYFQDGHVQVTTGCCGGGGAVVVGVTGTAIEDQSPLQVGGCVSYLIGGCAQYDPLNGGGGGGVAFGPGLGGFAGGSFTVLDFDFSSGWPPSVSSPTYNLFSGSVAG